MAIDVPFRAANGNLRTVYVWVSQNGNLVPFRSTNEYLETVSLSQWVFRTFRCRFSLLQTSDNAGFASCDS